MNIKRVLLVTAILMIVISSLSIVSAGWFDFGSDGKEIDATIINGTLEVKEHTVRDSDSIGAFEVLPDGSSDIEEGYVIEGNLVLDISDSGDEFKNTLTDILNGKGIDENSTLFSIFVDNDITTGNADLNDFNENDVHGEFNANLMSFTNESVVIHLKEVVTAKDVSELKNGLEIPIESGKISIYILDIPENNVTINF